MINLRYPNIVPSLFSILLGCCALLACSGDSGDESFDPPIRPAKLIEIADPQRELERQFPGTVVSADSTTISFRVGGRLSQLPIRRQIGGKVEAGALLAALDQTDYRNAFKDAEADFELARAQYNRGENLVEKGFISANEYDRLKAAFKAADAALSQARTNLAYTRLEAPFGGRIAQVMVKNHESVRADQPIAILEGAERVDVELQIPTSFMAQVPERNKAGYRAGQRGLQMLKITFGNRPDVVHEGYISEIETQPDPATLTYRVVVSLPAPEEQEILPGMTARVSIDLIAMGITNPRLMVPGEALFSADQQALDQGEASVWLLDKQSMRVSRRAVTIGEISSFGVEVKQGLEPGDTIVAAGVHYLTEGVQVRELEREGGL